MGRALYGALTRTATSVPASLHPPPCREGKKREYPGIPPTESSMNRKCLEASKHQPAIAGETPQASIHKLSYFSYSSEEMTMIVYLEWAISAHTDLTTCVLMGAHPPIPCLWLWLKATQGVPILRRGPVARIGALPHLVSLAAIVALWSIIAKTYLMSLLPTAEACPRQRDVVAYCDGTKLEDNRASEKNGLPQVLGHIKSHSA